MPTENAERNDRESQLDEVIASYLEALESGEVPDRTSWLQRYPHLADELAAFFADEARFDGLVAPLKVATPTPHSGLTPTNGLGGPPPHGPVASVAPAPVRGFGDYELLEEAARGGMGIVYRARQVSLNRIVALKVIRDAEWVTPGDVQRFRLEAEAVAQLDHPHIVPVYDVGEWRATADAAPVHYFSMKWVDGGTLAQLLTSGHWSAAHRDGQRAAARLLAEVARAVHYAHQRGILHRDLKPANILLTGVDLSVRETINQPPTPLITDFGLAKRVAVDDHLTQTGVAVGTPSYMAPEQAAPGGGRDGKGAGPTMAADVYSLGAILYELLTGRPPFRGESMLDTLRQVLEREPERPRSLNAKLDRDLETICLKCLHKDPARRYASAAALADDLERFLGGEPIQARPVRRAERLWRWCRRNPTLAATSLLAALALPAALALLALVAINESHHAARLDEEKSKVQKALADLEHKHAEAQRQRAEADRQRRREERSFRQAHRAVSDFYTRFADELRPTPGLQPLRKKLFEAARGYYQNFLEQRKDDPRLRRELADAQFDVAHMNSDLGARVEAAAGFRQALALYEELLKASPGDMDLRFRAANACHSLGLVLSVTGRPKEAQALYERALTYYRALLRDRPENPRALGGLSDLYAALGSLHRQAGRLAESHDAFGEAVRIREKLAAARPRDLHLQGALALCYNNFGVSQSILGRKDEALASYEKARAIREKLVEADPQGMGPQMALAASYRDIGLSLRNRGNRAEALNYLQRARDMRARVAKQNPRLMTPQSDLASSHNDVGVMLRDVGKRSEALSCFEQARAIQEKLLSVDPVSPYLRADLAATCYTLGNFHRTGNQLDKALKAFAKAQVLETKLVADVPAAPAYRSDLATTLNDMGQVLSRLKRPDEARTLLQQAVEHQRRAVALAPQVSRYRRLLVTHYGTLTEIELTAGRAAAAVAATLERQKLTADDPREQYWVGCDLAWAAAVVGQGKASLSDEERAERDRYADLAMAALQRAVAGGFRDRQRFANDRQLKPLRGRPDFRKLLADLGQ